MTDTITPVDMPDWISPNALPEPPGWTPEERAFASERFADDARRAARQRADIAETALRRCAVALAERWAEDNAVDDSDAWVEHAEAIADCVYDELLAGLAPDEIGFGRIAAGYLEGSR